MSDKRRVDGEASVPQGVDREQRRTASDPAPERARWIGGGVAGFLAVAGAYLKLRGVFRSKVDQWER